MTVKQRKRCVSFSFQGKRYYCYGSTVSEASDKAECRKQDLKSSLLCGRECPTLDEYFTEWESGRKGTIRCSTERMVNERFKAISSFKSCSCNSSLGDLKLTNISKQDVIDLQRHLSGSCATSTTNATLSLLRTLLNEAVNDRLIEWNPCNGVKSLKRTELPARDTKHRALSGDETRVFFRHARSSWYYYLYKFLLHSGVRCGEAGALTTGDLGDDFIFVRRTVTRVNGGFEIGECPKTAAGRRDIPYTSGLKEIIEKQLSLNSIFLHKKADIPGLIFFSRHGGIMYSNYIDTDIRSICLRAGIRPFTAHAFRDTFATRAIESGMNPKTLQELLGHSSYSITMSLYAHVMPSTKVKEMEKMKVE